MQPLKFKPVVKDQLFYNNFKYCMAFELDEVSALKTLDHSYIDVVIDRRILWREISQQRQIGVTWKQTIITKRWKDITDTTIHNLHELADVLINTSIPFKLVTSVNQAYLYTSSITLLKKVSTLRAISNLHYSEAVINRPKNTIKLNTPKHEFRSYLKSIKLNDSEKQSIRNFLNNQKDSIRISPSLLKWIETPYHRTQDYFFIDYNSESWLVMLALVKPGLIRKTVNIISA